MLFRIWVLEKMSHMCLDRLEHPLFRKWFCQNTIHSYQEKLESNCFRGNTPKKLTMFKIAVYLIRTDVGCHGDDWCRWTVLSDIHCGRDTIELRHDDVHEDEIKVVPTHGTDSAICIGSVFLFQKKKISFQSSHME